MEHQKAKNQDGFIYGIRKLDGWRAITADPFYATSDTVEITWRKTNMSEETKTNNELCRLLPNNYEIANHSGKNYRFIELIEINYGGYAVSPAAYFLPIGLGTHRAIYYGLELADAEFKIKEHIEVLQSKPMKDLTASQKALILNYEHNLTLKPNSETKYPPEDKRMIKKC